jgi:RNA polymerase sigma-70 factor (ECF subfamily)
VLDSLIDSDIIEALDDLPEQFRLAVVLSDLEDFSYAEMAEIMDVPLGTVMSRLHRGRKALQKRLWELAQERGIIKTPPPGVDGKASDNANGQNRDGGPAA